MVLLTPLEFLFSPLKGSKEHFSVRTLVKLFNEVFSLKEALCPDTLGVEMSIKLC